MVPLSPLLGEAAFLRKTRLGLACLPDLAVATLDLVHGQAVECMLAHLTLCGRIVMGGRRVINSVLKVYTAASNQK